jgi:magnesium transporter
VASGVPSAERDGHYFRAGSDHLIRISDLIDS